MLPTVFIYALCEPGTRAVRYIGKTINPARRLRQHCFESRKHTSPLGRWMASLGKARPNMIVLCEVPDVEWEGEERRYIRCARAIGLRLVNYSEGGAGGEWWHSAGMLKSPEHRAALKKPKTNLHREQLRESVRSAWEARRGTYEI